MSGFNKIMQLQPRTHSTIPSSSTPATRSMLMSTPSPLNTSAYKGMHRTYADKFHPSIRTGGQRSSTPLDMSTPHLVEMSPSMLKSPSGQIMNLPPRPVKKRMTEIRESGSQQGISHTAEIHRENMGVYQHVNGKRTYSMMMPDGYEINDDSINAEELPANQLGLYPDGYGHLEDEGATVENKRENHHAEKTVSGKVSYERVKEDTIEMGGFVLPGSERKVITKSYNWIAGRADGQYRVVLGNNTLFKPKNAIDSKTGEKDSTRWRVIRFENRYKENYPYTEFPAKYIDTLINALQKAKEQYDVENEPIADEQ